ncbi:MAG: hypothetical protein JF616_09715 [Fibrobacteres bacterium]|nr:hypothetical protein [Fibrobacterota bacterium]
MSTTSRFRAAKGGIGLLALVVAACIQGPWDYYPENPATFRGVFATAYVLSGKPLEQVCFERILDVDEEHTQAFAWYDSADVRISGPFYARGTDSTAGKSLEMVLSPVSDTPNCFKGDPTLLAERGQEYDLRARFTWDSAGTRTRSLLTGTAHVPKNFRIHDSAVAPTLAFSGGVPDTIFDPVFISSLPKSILDSMTAQFGDTLVKLLIDSTGRGAYLKQHGDAIQNRLLELIQEAQQPYPKDTTLYYLNGELNTLSHYFSSDHSEDVGAVLITQRFDPNSERPETRFDSPFGGKPDTSRYYFPGNIRRLLIYPNATGAKGWNLLDSMGVVNTWFFTLLNRFYFYGFEKAYYDFHASATEVQGGGGSNGDPRVKPRYNVQGGAGIFAGGIPDSFDLHIIHDRFTKAYPLPIAHVYACEKDGWGDSKDCRDFYPEYCRDQAWRPAICHADAIRLCLDTAAARDSTGPHCDSVAIMARSDTVAAPIGQLMHCVEKDFPDEPACAGPRTACLETKGKNDCKDWFWDYCQDHDWRPLDLCGPALASYCRDKPRQSETLCRNADAWCAANADSPLCK